MNSRKEFNAHMLQLLHYPRLLIKMFYSTMPRRRRRRYTEMVCLQHCRTTTIYHKFYYVQLDSRHNDFPFLWNISHCVRPPPSIFNTYFFFFFFDKVMDKILRKFFNEIHKNLWPIVQRRQIYFSLLFVVYWIVHYRSYFSRLHSVPVSHKYFYFFRFQYRASSHREVVSTI